jgi:hypothetical protein
LIEDHVFGWLESCAPESYSERGTRPAHGSRGSKTTSASNRPPENSGPLGTLVHT